jgi:hypothetical protein
MKNTQYDDLPVGQFVPNPVLRRENAPDLPGSESREPLSEARLRRYALDATENQTYGARSRAGIDGLQELVRSAQVRVRRPGPAKRHRISAVTSGEEQ